jgi:hypothetical protein
MTIGTVAFEIETPAEDPRRQRPVNDNKAQDQGTKPPGMIDLKGM